MHTHYSQAAWTHDSVVGIAKQQVVDKLLFDEANDYLEANVSTFECSNLATIMWAFVTVGKASASSLHFWQTCFLPGCRAICMFSRVRFPPCLEHGCSKSTFGNKSQA